MQIVNDKNLSINGFESGLASTNNDARDPFKSIFETKIESNNQITPKNNFQYDNKLRPKIVNIPHSVKDYLASRLKNQRQELLDQAETAKKEEDQDILNAQSLLSRVEQYLFNKDVNTSKSFYVNKEQLFSTVKGFQKLVSADEKLRPLEYHSTTKPKVDLKESKNEANPIEKRKVIIQFKDARITFTPEKSSDPSKNDLYQVQISNNPMEANDIETSMDSPIASDTISDRLLSEENDVIIQSENLEKVNYPKELVSLQQVEDDSAKTESASQTVADDNLSDQNETTEILKDKNGVVSKEKLVELVKSNSPEAAQAISEDVNLKVEFKPFAEVLKENFKEKIIKSNQDAVSFVVSSDSNELEGVDKIVPSGNLKELLNSQNGVLQVAGKLQPTLPVNEDGIVLLEENIVSLIDESDVVILETKGFKGFSDKSALSLSGGKDSLDAPSSSVLERINQVAMVQKISNRIQLRQLKEFGVVNLQLDPPELGKLLVRMTIKGKEIKVSIFAENSSAHDMLKNHKNIFIQSMKENGLDISEFDVNMSGNSNQNSSSQMHENQERLNNREITSSISSDTKSKNQDNLQGNLDSVNLPEGHRISLIA